MSKSAVFYTLEEVEDVLAGEGPVPFGEIRLRRCLPETYSGTSGGRPFAGFSVWGTCPFGPCECIWECYEGEAPDWDEPHWVYVYTQDGHDVLIAGTRM